MVFCPEDGSPSLKITGDFYADDIELLRLFVVQMSRVREARLLQTGLPGISNIRFANNVLEFVCKEYTNADLHELLHVLRPLILENERASFQRVAALIGRRFGSRELADHLRTVRKVFNDGIASLYMQISLENQPLFDASVLNMWLNGTQYHTDSDKADEWAKVERTITEKNARALLMNQLHGKVHALMSLQYLVDLILQGATSPATSPRP